MFKRVILLSISLCFLTGISGQDNIIKLGLATGNLGIQYEKSVGQRVSTFAQFGFAVLAIEDPDPELRLNGYGFYLGGRYYLSKKKDILKGWYLGPFIKQLNLSQGDNERRTNAFSIGLTSGIQWVGESSLTFELVFGIGTLSVDYGSRFINTGNRRRNENYLLNLGAAIGKNF